MDLTHHKPVARGVSQLMYVGDAEPSPSISGPLKIGIAIALAWLLLLRR